MRKTKIWRNKTTIMMRPSKFTLCGPIALVLLLAFAACKPRLQSLPTMMSTYRYINSLSSTYTLRPDSLVYDPIKPAQSSSGFADGGAPAARALDSRLYQNLAEAFETAIATPADHVPTRMMGCGTIIKESGSHTWSYYLAMGSIQKETVESMLKATLSQP